MVAHGEGKGAVAGNGEGDRAVACLEGVLEEVDQHLADAAGVEEPARRGLSGAAINQLAIDRGPVVKGGEA